jgi:hypothetical protein
MSLLVDPPWALGQTLGVSSTSDGTGWVGAVKEFTDVNPSTGVIRSNRRKICVAVRNTSGGALLPKKVVKFDIGTAGTAVLGAASGDNTAANASFVGVVDEHLPSAGVSANDVFWVTVEGPTEVITHGTVAVGAALSTVTTAGRVDDGGTAVIGYALSAGSATDEILAVVNTDR